MRPDERNFFIFARLVDRATESGVQLVQATERPRVRRPRRNPGRVFKDGAKPNGEKLGIERINLRQL